MIFKSISVLLFFVTKNIFCLTPSSSVIHKCFIKHDKKIMFEIFPNMYKFLDYRSKNMNDYNKIEMYETYKLQYKDACRYLLYNKPSSNYIGWTPFLYNKELFKKYYKSIIKKIDFQTNIKYIPLYYLVCESNSLNNTLEVKKILCNPTIEVNIDLKLLKSDLKSFCNLYNTTLDLSQLKYYDDGRWYFEFKM